MSPLEACPCRETHKAFPWEHLRAHPHPNRDNFDSRKLENNVDPYFLFLKDLSRGFIQYNIQQSTLNTLYILKFFIIHLSVQRYEKYFPSFCFQPMETKTKRFSPSLWPCPHISCPSIFLFSVEIMPLFSYSGNIPFILQPREGVWWIKFSISLQISISLLRYISLKLSQH